MVLEPFAVAAEVDDIARENGWNHVQRIPKTDDQFYEEIYEIADGKTTVRFIEDHYTMIPYIVISGNNQKVTETLVRSKIESYTEDQLWEWAEKGTRSRRELAIRCLGAIAPDTADERFVECFTAAANAKQAMIRRAAIISLARVAWPELWPIVRERAKNERNEEVRKLAQNLQRAYEKLVLA